MTKANQRYENPPNASQEQCLHKFTAAAGKNKTYTPRVVLETVSTYNLGNSVSDTQRIVRKRMHVDIPEGTIRSWVREYKPLTPYARMRTLGSKLFGADEMIRSFLLRHKQVYRGEKWCRRGESNPRPRDYETLALPLSYAGTK